MRNIRSTGITLIAAMLLASCQSFGPKVAKAPGVPVAPPTPAPVVNKPKVDTLSGKWVPADGPNVGKYEAIFRKSQFISKSLPEGNILAKGNYTAASNELIKLKFEGAASKTVVTADCRRNSPALMTCTPSKGSPFNLKKAG